MSYQRAVVNCRKCYEIASPHVGDRTFPNICEEFIKSDLNLHQLRNDAMKALEDETTNPIAEKEKAYMFERADNLHSKIRGALTACMNCDYKKARIAEIFDPVDESV